MLETMLETKILPEYTYKFFSVSGKQYVTDMKEGGSRYQGRKFAIWVLIFLLFAFLQGFAFGQTTKEEKYREVVSKDIPYGREKESVGLLSVKELPRIGPGSFTSDSEGNFYICDTVNNRIQIFSLKGEYKFTIPLEEEITAGDVAVDKNGFIYIYDLRGKLYQYGKKGNLISAISVNNARLGIRMGMHIVDSNIYISNTGQKDVLIGRIMNGSLVAPTEEELRRYPEKGLHGLSGRRYIVNLTRWEKGEIQIIDQTSDIIKSIGLPIKGIVSIQFLREDKKGNFYIQTERVDNENILLEVQKYDSDGNYLTTILIPETNYYSWTVKLLSLDENGNIYQFLPAKEKGRLIIFCLE